MNENFLSIFNQKKNFDKKSSRKSERKKAHHSYRLQYTTLFIYITLTSSLRSVFSPFVNIKRDVYDNYVSRDEEKRTDDKYQEELLFVFCFCGRESFSFVVHIISSICIGDGVN